MAVGGYRTAKRTLQHLKSTAMNELFRYEKLEIWQIGMSVVESVYRVTASFPPGEIYGLTSQMRRAAVSIPANIAEGYGRTTRGAFAASVRVARGSLYELRTLVEVAGRINILEDGEASSIHSTMIVLSKKLDAFLKSLDNVVVKEEEAAYG